MIDFHCHILPGVDDGAESMSEALAMARLMVADGITHVAATPHCQRHSPFFRDEILPHVERLNAELQKERIPLVILPGSEIQVTDTDAYRREYQANRYCHLGDRKAFTLFEFPWRRDQFPADTKELVAWLVKQGTIPIIAHPERHPYLAEQPERLEEVVQAGAWIQITVDSLLGNHGAAAYTAADKLLREYPAAVLSTDAHNLRRCSGLSPGFKWVRSQLGALREAELRASADQIFVSIAGSLKGGD